MRISVLPALLCAVLATSNLQAQPKPQGNDLVVEHGTYVVHLLLHAIGSEEYTVTQPSQPLKPGARSTRKPVTGSGDLLTLTSQLTLNDRGNRRSVTSTLSMDHAFTPMRLEQHATPDNGAVALTEISGNLVQSHEAGQASIITRPPVAFMGFTQMPASLQMMMMRYWKRHGQPARLNMLRASDRALPLEIKLVGYDAFQSHGHMVRLARYTVDNLVFGREILWMNDSFRLAAIMTFAGGLPQELVLDEYESVLGELYHCGVRQQMLDLADLTHAVAPEATGAYAIVGARLIDGTGAPAVENATVIVRDGLIAAAGAGVPVPAGLRVIHAEGQSLLPGLWEMHTHYSGVEFGPALLAAGITSARDCGGEFEFLTTVRRKIDEQHQLGPRLLLAGLVDSGGPLAFGAVDVSTPAEATAAVDTYADAKFDQIKVYTQLSPLILKYVASEAHHRGLTVTGHVPAAVDTFAAIADGMDQINHLQFITKPMTPPGASAPDLNSQNAKELLALLKQFQIVVDPTDGWAEMAGHPRDVDPATFEPGLNAAPYTLATKYRSLGSAPEDAEKFQARLASNAKVILALHQAGIPIVAGSDTALLGYGLDRELELYVQAGLTPMQAIQTATLAAARAMKHDRDSGTVEPGKRADLVLVQGNPLANISDLRRVVSVVKQGDMYDSRKLGKIVGFNR
jgi:imidazolonepropionase-like amidohydrolase